MNLPKIDLPTFEFEIPSSGKKVKFRPFLVKEQKILLMALESADEKDAMRAIKQIVSNCVLEENFDVDDLSSFDLDYFFIQLRVKSIGEKINLSYRCKNIVEEDKECNNLMEFEHDLSTVKIERNKSHNKTIFFTKDSGLVMKYPGIKISEMIMTDENKNKTSIEKEIEMITECIDYIFDKDTIYPIKEISKKELIDYIETLSRENFEKIQTFFDTVPEVKSTIEQKCKKCGFEHVIPVEGLVNFFV